MANEEKDLESVDVIENESTENLDEKEQKKIEKMVQKEMKKSERNEKKEAKLQANIDKTNSKLEEVLKTIAETPSESKKEKSEKAKLRKQRDVLKKDLDFYNSEKAKSGRLAPSKRKAFATIIACVLVIALLFGYIGSGIARNGLLGYLGVPQSSITGLVVTDGDGKKHPIKVSTYNYYFATYYNQISSIQSSYSQYGLDLSSSDYDVDLDKSFDSQTYTDDDGNKMTWSEHIQDVVIDNIKSTYIYYYEALKANDGKEPSITKTQKDEMKDGLKELEENANSNGYELDGYINAALGHGVTLSVYKREAKIAYISENYKEEYQKDLNSKEYTDKEYNKYKKDNYDDLVSVTARAFECDTEDDAKAFVKALKADGSNFTELCVKYSSEDFYKKAYKDPGYSTEIAATKSVLKNNGYAIATAETNEKTEEETYPGLDWVFSKKRAKGDVKQYSTTVIYILKPVSISNINTVNVRHILINPLPDDADDSATAVEDATQKEWDEAYKTAKKVLKEYNKGEKTSESFAKLVEKYSEDTGSADNGGLYENVYPGQMVKSFSYWSFNTSRKAGDVAIVKSDYGYHIMRFESTNDMPAWKYTAQQSLASDDSTDTIDELEKSYSIKETWLGSRFFEKDTDIDS